MKSKMGAYLFLSNFAIFVTGIGLLPLLPVYAAELGASRTVIGLYLAATYIAISLGSLLAEPFSRRFGTKRVFLVAGFAGVPAVAALGQAQSLWQAILFSVFVWFVGGIGLALIAVLTALHADNKKRGRAFGLMSLTRPLAAVLGGLAMAFIVQSKGFATATIVLAVAWAAWPLPGLLFLQDDAEARQNADAAQAAAGNGALGTTFLMLLLVMLLSTMTLYVAKLGVSLSMQSLSFSTTAISSTTVAGGLVAIPATYLIGALSDKVERKQFLTGLFIIAAAVGFFLMLASRLWHFWMAAALVLVAQSSSGAVASAFATDLLAPSALRRGLPWLNATTFIAGILGYASTGFAIDALGSKPTYAVAGALSLVAVVMLLIVGGRASQQTATATVRAVPVLQVGPGAC